MRAALDVLIAVQVVIEVQQETATASFTAGCSQQLTMSVRRTADEISGIIE
jgi:hypothetical protein